MLNSIFHLSPIMAKLGIINDLFVTQSHQLRPRGSNILYNTLTNISLLYLVTI